MPWCAATDLMTPPSVLPPTLGTLTNQKDWGKGVGLSWQKRTVDVEWPFQKRGIVLALKPPEAECNDRVVKSMQLMKASTV